MLGISKYLYFYAILNTVYPLFLMQNWTQNKLNNKNIVLNILLFPTVCYHYEKVIFWICKLCCIFLYPIWSFLERKKSWRRKSKSLPTYLNRESYLVKTIPEETLADKNQFQSFYPELSCGKDKVLFWHWSLVVRVEEWYWDSNPLLKWS